MSSPVKNDFPRQWLFLLSHWLVDRIDRRGDITDMDVVSLRKAVIEFLDREISPELHNLCASLLLLEARPIEVNAPLRAALRERLITIKKALD